MLARRLDGRAPEEDIRRDGRAGAECGRPGTPERPDHQGEGDPLVDHHGMESSAFHFHIYTRTRTKSLISQRRSKFNFFIIALFIVPF